MFQQIFLAVIGFCAGVIIAGGVVGLLIGLSIVPRYAGVTHTGKHILLYEDITLLGIVFGNLFFLYRWPIPGGMVFLGLCGLFSGIFLGGWIMALAEMADVFPIFSRRKFKSPTSNPFRVMFANVGEMMPPCGVPSSVRWS